MRRGEKPVHIIVTEPVRVDSLDLEAQGIARLTPNEEELNQGQSGKVVFIQGALPTELVTYVITRDKARFSKAKVLDILNTLGLSNWLMKSIEKRDVVDRAIVFAGICVILLLLGAIYYFRWHNFYVLLL